MALPNIKFNIATNGLDLVGDGILKTPGFIVTGNSVANGVKEGTAYQIFSLKEAEKLGISEDANPFAHKHVKDFYDQTGESAELWIMLVPPAVTYEQMADVNNEFAKKLIITAKGAIRVLGLVKKAGEKDIVENGLDKDVQAGIVKLQALAEHFEKKFMPFRAIISGNKFSGIVADLLDYTKSSFRNVNMLIANNDGAPEASIGLALGKQASIPSQRNQARVKDGAVINLNAYFTSGQAIEELSDALDAIHDKGYTFFRSFPGRAGFFFSDDQTLILATDDFSSLARGFVMDEAVLVAYDTLINELGDEVPMAEDGTIHPAIIKTWQSNVDNRLQSLMIDTGKLSGARIDIDSNQNILSTNKLEVTIKLLPVGYAKYVEVNIGFTTKINK